MISRGRLGTILALSALAAIAVTPGVATIDVTPTPRKRPRPKAEPADTAKADTPRAEPTPRALTPAGHERLRIAAIRRAAKTAKAAKGYRHDG